MKINNNYWILLFTILWQFHSYAQFNTFGENFSSAKNRKPIASVTKTGAYFGLQVGKYTVPEIGGERQWKQIRLNNPRTHALHTGFNYNIKHKVLGYDLGYWYKPNRLGLTYGANLVYRTNFELNKFGVAPVIGYKIWQLHAQTGYHILTGRNDDFETNTFFISIRFVMVNDRDWKFNKRKKKDD